MKKKILSITITILLIIGIIVLANIFLIRNLTPNDEETQIAQTNQRESTANTQQEISTNVTTDTVENSNSDKPIVYMTNNIDAESLVKIYETLGRKAEGNVAVKISTGEVGSNYLRTDLIGDLVRNVNGTIV